MKRDETNLFHEWLRAMVGGDVYFSGGEIVQTRDHAGRGARRRERAVEVAGCGLYLRDAASPTKGYDLVGGYSTEAEAFYAYEEVARSLFNLDWLGVRMQPPEDFRHRDTKIDLPTALGRAFGGLIGIPVLLHGVQHPGYNGLTKLNAIKASNSGDLPADELRRGNVAKVLHDLLWSDAPRLALAVAAAYRDGGGPGIADRLRRSGRVNLSEEADDRITLMRVVGKIAPEKLDQFRFLPLGYPEDDDLLPEVVAVVDASVVY